jgi:hypothetical protein
MNHKKELVTEKDKDKVLKDLSDRVSPNQRKVQLQDILREMKITLDDPILEDTIDGTRIRAIYPTLLSRKKGTGEKGGEMLRFHYIKEVPVDYSNFPISFRDRASIITNKPKSDTTTQNNEVAEAVITESYEKLDEASPSLLEILGLIKRNYFMPEDFSNRLAVDRIHELRKMFTKDEILVFPSVNPGNRAGLVPI